MVRWVIPQLIEKVIHMTTTMSTLQNRQFKLATRPVGMVKRSDFEFVTTPAAEPGPGEALVRVLYLSLDPAMRGWMNAGRSYIAPVGIGEVMRAGGIGRVVASNDPSLAVGDTVVGMTGVQDYAIVQAKTVTKVDPRLAPLPRYLGALGMPGLTAYFGLLDIGQPKEGETRGGLSRCRRGGRGNRTDRQDQRLPGGRYRGRTG